MAPGLPTQAVYAERIKRAQEKMKAEGIDVLLVGPSSDLFYLIGYNAHLSERMNLLM
jgi:Xaa-Pro aminopeptidase